ncbi:MAG: type II toxin-antitoxin system VapC family toxin [Dehalococcoidia bacterium]
MLPQPRVIDASIAVKWVVPAEQLWAEAEALLVASLKDELQLFGPAHMLGEVTNAIYQRLRTVDSEKHMSREEADEALDELLSYPLMLVMDRALYPRALEFARTYNLPSIYDSLYVVLAESLGAELWTADQRLLQAIGANAPWVRSLATFPMAAD